MAYHIDDQGCIITEPHTLRSWYNYLANDSYGLKISHLGDGYSSTLSEPYYYVTQHDPWQQSKGRWLYVKDQDTFWSPSYLPCRTTLDEYQCLHAPGYTRIMATVKGIQVESIHFVPLQGCYEIWWIKIANLSKTTRTISLYTCAEFLLHNEYLLSAPYHFWHVPAFFDEPSQTISFKTNLNPKFTGFCRSLSPISSFSTSLDQFVGAGGLAAPEQTRQVALPSEVTSGEASAGIFHYNIKLAASASESIACLIGGAGFTDHQPPIADLHDVADEFNKVKAAWKKRITIKNKAPSKKRSDTTRFLETFFPYQIYQQSLGLVRQGYLGVRDVCQDCMALCHFDAAKARKILLFILSQQYVSGRCLRQYYCYTLKHDYRDFRDLQFWQVFAVERYCKITGDYSILQTIIGYFDDGNKKNTVWEHLLAGVKYSLEYGKNNLICAHEGDWNDALSGLGDQGESIVLAQLAYLSLLMLNNLAKQTQLELNIDIEAHCKTLLDAVNTQWNGQWFNRAITSDGITIGGKNRIFSLPQAWYTISDMHLKAPEHAQTALDNVLKHLQTSDGLMILNPPYLSPNPHVGRITQLVPGIAENAGIYNHAAMFVVYALFKQKRCEQALELLNNMLPFKKDWQRYKAEPYVLGNFIRSQYAANAQGEAGQAWITSTINWLAMIYFDFIEPLQIEWPS